MKTIPNNPKEIEIMILLSYLFIFLVNFWVYHFFQNFDVFSWFRKLPMDSNWCFFMPWWSRDHPRLILDQFGKSHFFMKISQKWSLKVGPNIFVHPSKINPIPDLRSDSESFIDFLWLFLISLNSTDRILRKSQNKIEKGYFGDVED